MGYAFPAYTGGFFELHGVDLGQLAGRLELPRLIRYDNQRNITFFWEQQERRVAVCTARHRRLGARSWWREVEEEILRMMLTAPILYVGEDKSVSKGKEEEGEEEDYSFESDL